MLQHQESDHLNAECPGQTELIKSKAARQTVQQTTVEKETTCTVTTQVLLRVMKKQNMLNPQRKENVEFICKMIVSVRK